MADIIAEKGLISFLTVLINGVIGVATQIWTILETQITIPFSVLENILPQFDWYDITIRLWEIALTAEGITCAVIFIVFGIIKKFT